MNAILPEILAETDRWIVVNKPSGWLTIPGRSEGPIVLDWVKSKFASVFVVHRLDRETSGVLLFAKNEGAHREANGWFSSHQVKKAYDALALGRSPAPVFKVNSPIEGSPSATQFEVKETFIRSFRVRAVPVSGRRHQIRIHLSKEGYPILGDSLYGGPREVELGSGGCLNVERVALHAARLELPSREVFEASWPQDFAAWVERLQEEK